ncbi:YciI family protein [Melittangium boletus]|uniref:YciI family protein n=1 Tax=Melittangium boletus TaxID=83453 RepID=UPI003DA293C1
MTYMLLIMEDARERRERPSDEGREKMDRMIRFGEDLKARGLFRASESLRTDAVRLTHRGGRRVISDGPFSEAKELIGGFFLVECETREQALALAQECPAADWATIEVRELGPCYNEG